MIRTRKLRLEHLSLWQTDKQTSCRQEAPNHSGVRGNKRPFILGPPHQAQKPSTRALIPSILFTITHRFVHASRFRSNQPSNRSFFPHSHYSFFFVPYGVRGPAALPNTLSIPPSPVAWSEATARLLPPKPVVRHQHSRSSFTAPSRYHKIKRAKENRNAPCPRPKLLRATRGLFAF